MAIAPTHEGDLEQVVELNRLFLRLLKSRATKARPCLGLDAATARRLGELSDARLDALAELPRALFRLNLDTEALPPGESSGGAAMDGATRSLQLAALLTAWNFSRRSIYTARLFLGLSALEITTLSALTLSDLPPLAATDGLVSAAFEDTRWLWRELLEQSRPEQRRRLLLVALQPRTLVATEAARRAAAS